jgi:hypothetical protein
VADWVLFDEYRKSCFNGTSTVDLDTDTLKIMLTTSTYSPSQSHDFKDDVTNEVSGSNYTAGGVTCSGATVTLASNVVKFAISDPSWAQHASGFTNARTAVLYKSTGVDSTSRLIAYVTFASDVGNVSGDLTLQINATNGIFTSP